MTPEDLISTARESGAEIRNGDFCFDPLSLSEFEAEIRKKALLKAADEFGRIWTQTSQIQKELRRMAEGAE